MRSPLEVPDETLKGISIGVLRLLALIAVARLEKRRARADALIADEAGVPREDYRYFALRPMAELAPAGRYHIQAHCNFPKPIVLDFPAL
jgi:hypothetical protein